MSGYPSLLVFQGNQKGNRRFGSTKTHPSEQLTASVRKNKNPPSTKRTKRALLGVDTNRFNQQTKPCKQKQPSKEGFKPPTKYTEKMVSRQALCQQTNTSTPTNQQYQAHRPNNKTPFWRLSWSRNSTNACSRASRPLSSTSTAALKVSKVKGRSKVSM